VLNAADAVFIENAFDYATDNFSSLQALMQSPGFLEQYDAYPLKGGFSRFWFPTVLPSNAMAFRSTYCPNLPRI
jgi:hypothetical protein